MSNYNGKKMHRMYHRCDDLNVPFIINQNRYSIFDRTVEKNDLKKEAKSKKKGLIAFSPLAQGQLTDKLAGGIVENSRLYNNEVLQKKVGYSEGRRRLLSFIKWQRIGDKHFLSLQLNGFCNGAKLQAYLSAFTRKHSFWKT